MPRDVPFMKMALLDQLLHRPYHAVILEGPFNLPRLAHDHAKALFRSETLLTRKGKPSIERLLLTLGDGVFGFLDDEGDAAKKNPATIARVNPAALAARGGSVVLTKE